MSPHRPLVDNGLNCGLGDLMFRKMERVSMHESIIHVDNILYASLGLGKRCVWDGHITSNTRTEHKPKNNESDNKR